MRKAGYARCLTVLIAAFVITLMASPFSYATEKYHVTVSGGLHGTVNGKAKVDVMIPAGGEWNPNDYTVKVTDDRYYFKGFHISGIEGTLAGAGTTQEDRVYVADFGVKGNLVRYTVRFVDKDGKSLLPDMTAYGQPGDKPVIAYRYVEGYLPEAYNLTKTLSADAGKNVFTFRYNKNAAETTVVEEEEPGDNGGNNGNGQNGTDGTGTNPDDNQNVTPDDKQDLDDNETPAAGKKDENTDGEDTIIDGETPKAAQDRTFRLVMGLPIGILILAVIFIICLILRRGRREE